MGIAERQKGHSFVAGAAGASCSLFSLLIFLITRNTAKATIRKLIIVLKNTTKVTITKTIIVLINTP